MNAIEVKRIIDSKLVGIENSIAFFCGDKYKEIIHSRMENLRYYIFDSYQKDRIESIELVDIARAFAKYITIDLKVSQERKKELDKIIGDIIYNVSQNTNSQNYLDTQLSLISEFSQDLNNYKTKINELIEVYKNDYEVNLIYKKLDEYKIKKEQEEAIIRDCKKQVLDEILSIKGNFDIDRLWVLLDAFSDDANEYDKEEVVKRKKEFYTLLGCVGEDLIDLEKDALNKKIVINNTGVCVAKSRYETYFNDRIYDKLKSETNVEDIASELSDLDLSLNIKNIVTYIYNNPLVVAYNTFAYDNDNDPYKFIVFVNNKNLYNVDFTTTVIHELLHYIGGYNSKKFGLHFHKNEKLKHLEEAYVCYLSKKIANEYIDANGFLIEPRDYEQGLYYYDPTNEYFEEVYKLYGDELMKYHFSNDAKYDDVISLLPINDIAESIERIIEAPVSIRKSIIKEEINKLPRRVKR